MNYQLNVLARQLECSETPIFEFSSLKYGKVDGKIEVFDATEYCIQEKLPTINYASLCATLRFWIERIVEKQGLSITSLFYQNKDGHLLVNKWFTYPFLMYASPSAMDYFFSLIDGALSTGVAFSDSYIANIIQERMPDEFLMSIMESRNGNR